MFLSKSCTLSGRRNPSNRDVELLPPLVLLRVPRHTRRPPIPGFPVGTCSADGVSERGEVNGDVLSNLREVSAPVLVSTLARLGSSPQAQRGGLCLVLLPLLAPPQLDGELVESLFHFVVIPMLSTCSREFFLEFNARVVTH